MTDDRDDPAERIWERGWGGHERAQRLRLARLTLREKLEWLEAAHRMVRHMTGTRRAQRE